MNKENIDFNRKFMYRGEMIDLTDEGMRRRQYNEAKNAVEVFKSKYPGLDSFDVTEDSNNNLVLVFDESIKFDVMNLICINAMTDCGLTNEAKILSDYL